MLVDDRELTERAARIDALLEEVQSFPDPSMREKATEIVESLLLLYGEGLARMLDHVVSQVDPDASDRILEALGGDELVSHLLLLHDLHPVSVETRILGALDGVRPYLESHGGNVELLEVENGVVKLQLQGSCHGCPSSTMTLKLAIEEAVFKAAPELERIEAEGVAQPRPMNFMASSDIIPLVAAPRPPAGPSWVTLEGAPDEAGSTRALDAGGTRLLLVNESGQLYAYRNACAACGGPLAGAELHDRAVSCPTCGSRFDVRAAGRSLDGTEAHLEPVPLLMRDGTVRVAVDNRRSAGR